MIVTAILGECPFPALLRRRCSKDRRTAIHPLLPIPDGIKDAPPLTQSVARVAPV